MIKQLTSKQRTFLETIEETEFLDSLNEEFVDFTDGDDEQLLLDDSNYWQVRQIKETVTEVLVSGKYGMKGVPPNHCTDSNMLNSLCEYWRRRIK